MVKQFFISWASSLLSLMFFDALWFALMGKNFYGVHLAHLIAPTINFIAVLSVYFICALGIALLVVLPFQSSLLKILLHGLLLGFVVYGTYNFTNQAILKDWPMLLMFVDVAWGSVVFGVVSLSAALVLKMIG